MRPRRPSHPALNVRDDREAPLLSEAGRGEVLKMICPTGQAECLRHFGTTGKSLETAKLLSSEEQLLHRPSFRSATKSRARNPWRHTCCREEWIPGLRLPAHPGMTAVISGRLDDGQITSSFRGATKSRTTMCNCTSENPWRHTCCREEWILRCAIAHHSLRLPRKVASLLCRDGASRNDGEYLSAGRYQLETTA